MLEYLSINFAPNMEAQELVQKIISGDEHAFEKLFRMFYQRLCNYALSMVKDVDIAEEIVQDVLVTIWQTRTKLQLEHAIRPYLYKAVHNRCLNHFRHETVKLQHQHHEMANADAFSTAASSRLELNEVKTRVEMGMHQLPPACREVFRLSRMEELSYKEIADFLGISVKTVENQMGKALKIMRKELADLLVVGLILDSMIIFSQTWGFINSGVYIF
jgi:RNA polymerase sigma-70 factor (family 1)